MLSSQFQKLLGAISRTQLILWLAFITACPVYVIMAHILDNDRGPGAEGPPPMLESLLPIVAVLLAAASIYYRRHAMSEKSLKKKLAKPVDPGVMLGSNKDSRLREKKLAEFQALSEKEQKLVGLLSHQQTTMIVAWALNEAIGVLGLVLVAMDQTAWWSIPYAGASMALNLLIAPRARSFVEGVEPLAQRASL